MFSMVFYVWCNRKLLFNGKHFHGQQKITLKRTKNHKAPPFPRTPLTTLVTTKTTVYQLI